MRTHRCQAGYRERGGRPDTEEAGNTPGIHRADTSYQVPPGELVLQYLHPTHLHCTVLETALVCPFITLICSLCRAGASRPVQANLSRKTPRKLRTGWKGSDIHQSLALVTWSDPRQHRHYVEKQFIQNFLHNNKMSTVRREGVIGGGP